MESESTTELPTPSGEKKPVRLVDVPVNTQQDALQLIVTFLNCLIKSIFLFNYCYNIFTNKYLNL